jgi:alkylated DNA repair dioxygenase AlkB
MNIHPNFITEGDEDALHGHIEVALEKIPQRKWQLRNRVLRFGWDYEKPKKWLGLPPDSFFVPIPAQHFLLTTDSVTINEYLRGQRIASHIDSKAFGDVVILSLLADVTMRFTSPAGATRDFLLLRRSLAVMSGELRDKWTHETLPLDADKRISIVYRKRIT